MLHGRHIYAKASDMENSTMCTYPYCVHALTHWKYVLRGCAKFAYINIIDQETDNHYSETTLSI